MKEYAMLMTLVVGLACLTGCETETHKKTTEVKKTTETPAGTVREETTRTTTVPSDTVPVEAPRVIQE